ncbi:MAG: PAS domain-containing protein [Phycisphaera sp.]|nr:PAS domain-containing protein [Phycisphaera sp.]
MVLAFSIQTALLLGSLAALCTALVMILRTNRAVDRLREASEQLAKGDLATRVDPSGPRRVGTVAEALNRMSLELDMRIQTAISQRNELEAVLASMTEGVVAIDMDEHIIKINTAGAALLDADPVRSLGRSIQEVVRNTALQRFVARTLVSDEPIQTELSLRLHPGSLTNAEERQLQVHGTNLNDAQGHRLGALVVLSDITRLRRLESVRRDFVANVSHELKTPVTAIKGAIETILDGSDHDPDEVRRFMGIIARQSDRMQAIIEDLLTLARLERDTVQQSVEVVPTRLARLLTATAETCQVQAEGKKIRIHVDCPPDLTVPINAALLEHAIVNLLDNAVKYSPVGSNIHANVEVGTDEMAIAIRDEGCGIEPEHLPRIFERFYRTDRARSRALGGTGLGLAIVKHVAQMHRGRVSVESAPGKGSTFRIHLPTARAIVKSA